MESATHTNFDRYVAVLVRSGLLEEARLADLLQDFDDEIGERDAQAFSDWLVQQQVLSQWQSWHLLSGRYKGFFLGRYKLLGYLGSGGMSRVYLAQHPTLKNPVAIKLLAPKGEEHEFQLRRFRMECEAISSLNHPNIVRAYDFDCDGRFYFLVMEYIDGPDLQRVVHHHGSMAYLTAAGLIRQAAAGLAHAHRHGIIHRDIKPSNLLVDNRGTVKILDMGVVRVPASEDNSITLEQGIQVIGTVDYLPPEQFVDSHNVDGRADIYSLGCTLYFLLTGEPPFNKGGQSRRILMHQTTSPPDLRRVRRDIPQGLADICERMLAKRPAARFQTADEVREVLTQWMRSFREGDDWRPQADCLHIHMDCRESSLDTVKLADSDTVLIPRKHRPRENPTEPIRIQCPDCDTRLKAPPAAEGKTAPCPRCGRRILITDNLISDKSRDLQAMVEQLLHAACEEDTQRLNTLIGQLVLPEPADWFRRVFGRERGLRAAHEYLLSLPRIKSAFRRFLERMAEKGLVQVSAEVVSPDEKQAEVDLEQVARILEAMRHPIPIYAIRLHDPGDKNRGISFGAFAWVADQFRFLGPLKEVVGEAA